MTNQIWEELKHGLRGAVELQPSSINAGLGNYEIRAINASKITAGTIDASQITVLNLDASQITAGSMSCNYLSGGTLSLGGTNDVSGVFSLKNSAGSEIVAMDKDGIAVAETGDITVGGDSINTNAEIFSHLTGVGVSGSASGTSAWTDWNTSRFSVDGDNFNNQNVYFEFTGEKTGLTTVTLSARLTDGTTVLDNSTISMTLTDPIWDGRSRGTATLSFPSGAREYKVQTQTTTAGTLSDVTYSLARLVIIQA